MGYVSISVILPCYNGAVELNHCLRALESAPYSGAEYIVIDDGSTEDLNKVVSSVHLPIRLIRMGARQGSARARNCGALEASGELLVFLDADTRVHSDTLSRISEAFENDPHLGALFGAYDDQPSQPNFYSQYRNLLHCYVHRTSSRQACTFWTGCGAIRRELFLRYGGFDETPRNVDDVELGSRLARDGVRIELQPEVQVTHQKRWSFLSTLTTDVLLRGVPWAILILRDRQMPDTLNVSYRNRASVLLAWFALLAGLFGCLRPAASGPVAWGLAITCLCAVIWLNRSFYDFLRDRRSNRFVLLALLAHLFHFLVCGISFFVGFVAFSLAGNEEPESIRNLLEAEADAD